MPEESLQRQWLYQVRLESSHPGIHIKKMMSFSFIKTHIRMESLKQPNKAEMTTQYLYTNPTYRSFTIFPTINTHHYLPHATSAFLQFKLQCFTTHNLLIPELILHAQQRSSCSTTIVKSKHASPAGSPVEEHDVLHYLDRTSKTLVYKCSATKFIKYGKFKTLS